MTKNCDINNIHNINISNNISNNIQISLDKDDFIMIKTIINNETNKAENIFNNKLSNLNYKLNKINIQK